MAIMDKFREMLEERNKNFSLIAGLLLFAGWWILIDAMAIDEKHQITVGEVFIGVFGTLSFFMVNNVKTSQIEQSPIAKIWILVGFIIGFASIIAAVWVMFANFINIETRNNWPGVALLLQNILILSSSLIFKFGRREEEWNI